MKNTDIRVLVQATDGLKKGGITSVILNYYRNMPRENMNIDFSVCYCPGKRVMEEIENNRDKLFLLPSKKNVFKYFSELCRIMKNGDYDIVHIHGNSHTVCLELLAALISGIKVRIVHSHSTRCKYKVINKVLTPVFNLLYTNALACGKEAGKWMFGKKNFTVLKNATDVRKYAYDEATREKMRERYGVNNKKVIGQVASFQRVKNHEFSIDILNHLDNSYCLFLLGSGYLESQIRQKVKNEGLENRVFFIGETNNVSEFLQAMDVFILPSLFEGLPMTAVEAQAAALPCLLSDRISKQVKITDNVEFLPIDNGVKIWVEAIKNACRNPHRQDDVSRQIAENGYDIRLNAKRLAEFYQDSLNNL